MVISPVVVGGGGASGGNADARCVGDIWDVLIILVP